MVSTATRKRRVASYIGAGIIPGEGGGVTPLGPTTATFTAGAASGSLIALITGLQPGETITGVTPNDGRLAIAGSGAQLVVGLSASSAGNIAAVLTSSAGRTLNMAITVSASTAAAIYDLQFQTQDYKNPAGATFDPFIDGAIVHSRSGPLILFDSNGKAVTYADGVKGINSRGFGRRKKTRTNLVRNMNTGAVAGSPGTLPTGHVISATPAGLTRTIAFGASDPDLNLPYIDVSFSGTPTANSTITYKFMNDAVITAATDWYMASCWMKVQAGAIPLGCSVRHIAAAYGASDSQSNGDRLLNRSRTEGPQRFAMATQNVNSRTIVDEGVAFTVVNGTPINYTIRIICGQFEKIDGPNDAPSLPILNDSASGTTYNADVISLAGQMLTHIQGGAGLLELSTDSLRGSDLSYRQDFPLITFNGSVAALKRTALGEVATDLPGIAKTEHSIRANFGLPQKHALSWTSSNIAVATTSSAHNASGAGSVPSISSVSIDADGYITRLRVGNAAYQPSQLAAYKAEYADVIATGQNLGSLHAIAEVNSRGLKGLITGDFDDGFYFGMCTTGLSAVDATNPTVYGGMGRDYMQWCSEFTGKATLDNTVIDSDIALLYCYYILKKYRINVRKTKGVTTVSKTGTNITALTTELGQTFTSISGHDAGYLGDVMLRGGASHFIGREAQDANNPWNGNRGRSAFTGNAGNVSNHQFTLTGAAGPADILPIDPFIIPGNPASGLIKGIQADTTTTVGAADGAVQAPCFRSTLTTGSAGTGAGGNWYPLVTAGSPPAGYDPSMFELFARYVKALTDAGSVAVSYLNAITRTTFNMKLFLLFTGTATKYDMNSNNGFSLDAFGQNWGPGFQEIMVAAGFSNPASGYADAPYDQRQAFKRHMKALTKGLFYFIAYSGDPRIPAQLASDAALFGLCSDMYNDPDYDGELHFMPRLYERENARIMGDDIATEADFQMVDGTVPRNLDIIGVASYAIDSHSTRRLAMLSSGAYYVINEGNLQVVSGGANTAVPLSAKWFMPKKAEITNWSMGFCASATHTAFGSFRMEMTQAQIGQSMGIIHALKILANDNTPLQDYVAANYNSVIRPALLAAGVSCPQVN